MPVTPLLGDWGLIRQMQGPWYDRVFADLIDWDTGSEFHHVVVNIGNGKIVEAVRTVRIDFADQYDEIVWCTGRLPKHLTPTPAQRTTIVGAALGMVGDKYNTVDILAIALAQKRLGRAVDGDEWWVKRLSADGRKICSQVADEAWKAAGLDMFPGRLPGLVSPGDMGRLLLPAAA
jgi:hypothetical protein